MKIAILARTLAIGGAQRQIVQLARGLRTRDHDVTVLVLYGGGVLTRDLLEGGVEVVDLRKGGRCDLVGFGRRLVVTLRAARPDVVMGFLLVQNVLLSLAAPVIGRPRVVWSFRSSAVIHTDPALRIVAGLARRLSGGPHAVTANSEAGIRSLEAAGFHRERLIHLPNAIDTDRFRPGDRDEARAHLGLDGDGPVLGVIARLDPAKDHPGLLRAFGEVVARRPDVRFVLVGDGPESYRTRLHTMAVSMDLAPPRLHWLGERTDVERVLPAFDLLVLGSNREGFPNVVAEAMACGIPCVGTAVGDTAEIIGDTGLVVPTGDPGRLAEACLELLAEDLGERGREARRRITERFGTDAVIRRAEDVLQA